MSQENVEIVRRIYAAYGAGDFESGFALIDPAVVFDAAVRPEGEIYHGHQGLANALRTWTGTWEAFRMEVEDVIDAGDKVVALERQSGRGKGSGMPLTQDTATVYEFQHGKVVKMVWFTDRRAALKAAGLSE